MALRRIVYLAALVGALVFYWAYRQWLSWLLLMLLVWLPWVSLALSLPAMIKLRPVVRCPGYVKRGSTVCAELEGECPLPCPPMKGKFRVRQTMTGRSFKKRNGAQLPTERCSELTLEVRRGYMYDYLGLFRWRLRLDQAVSIVVRPEPVPLDVPPDITRYLANNWKPKPGGGFAENHELRLYRPGDDLRQVHWKLSAKTGKLVLREPMEPLRGKAIVTLELRGSEQQVDEKLGKLLWVSLYLIEHQVPHEVHCLTGEGLVSSEVTAEQEAFQALDQLLRHTLAPEEGDPVFPAASWQYHIGGGSHEK